MRANTKVLKSKYPFKHCDTETLRSLAKTTIIESYQKGEVVFKLGDCDDKSVYLLSGKILMEAADGRSFSVKQGQREANFSLSNVRPRKYTGTAASHNTSVIWIHNKIIKHLVGKNIANTTGGIFSEVITDRRIQHLYKGAIVRY